MARCCRRRPADPGDAGNAGAGIVTGLAGCERPRQHADVMAVFGIHLSQRAAEETQSRRR